MGKGSGNCKTRPSLSLGEEASSVEKLSLPLTQIVSFEDFKNGFKKIEGGSKTWRSKCGNFAINRFSDGGWYGGFSPPLFAENILDIPQNLKDIFVGKEFKTRFEFKDFVESLLYNTNIPHDLSSFSIDEVSTHYTQTGTLSINKDPDGWSLLYTTEKTFLDPGTFKNWINLQPGNFDENDKIEMGILTSPGYKTKQKLLEAMYDAFAGDEIARQEFDWINQPS